ncbi:MAG: hypothetical protein LBE85_12245, partial [Candidatus Accumulibacter sp.]|nr:hypothetical protein [Accumulibacter sp.]
MNDTTFDTIEIHRPELARNYLGLLAAQPGRPLALFAPRRVGKTFFLDRDLAPAAERSGILPVYADLWLYRSDPLGAINHTLEEALERLTVPGSSIGKLAKTKVKGVNILGAGLALGDEPTPRALPETPELRLDALAARLVAAHNGKILLMLDEAQTLADAAPDLLATLRAVLHRQQEHLASVFTGSSQEGLARLMMSTGAPMYQFAQLITFPVLGDEYLIRLAAHFSTVHPGKRLDLAELRVLFEKIGGKPALLRDIVKTMSAEGMTDVQVGLKHHVSDTRQMAGWNGILQFLSEFDRQMLAVLARGLPPLGKQTLQQIEGKTGGKATIAKARASIGKLTKMGMLTKTGGIITFDDPLFAEFLAS